MTMRARSTGFTLAAHVEAPGRSAPAPLLSKNAHGAD